MRGLLAVVETELLQQLRQPLALLLLVLIPLLSVPGGLGLVLPAGEGARPTVVVAGDETFTGWVRSDDHVAVVSSARVPGTGDAGPGDALAEVSVSGSRVLVRYRRDLAASELARGRIAAVIARHDETMLSAALGDAALPRRLIDVTVADRTTAMDRTAAQVGRWLPVLLCLSMVTVAMYTALDVVSGEKERTTIEALLVTAARRPTLIVGKALVTTLLATAAGWLGLAGLVVGSWFGGPAPSAAGMLVWMGLAGLLAAQLGAAGVLLAAWVPDYRTGSMWAAPLMLVGVVPLTLLGIGEVEMSVGWALLPVANVIVLGRTWSEGTLGPGIAVVAVGLVTMQIIAGWAVAWGRLHRPERWLVGAVRASPRIARLTLVTAAWAGSTVALWWARPWATALHPVWGRGLLDLVVYGGLAWAVVRWLGVGGRRTVGWGRPQPWDVGMAALAGLSLPCVVAIVGALQMSRGLGSGMPKFSAEAGWVPALAVFVVIPAVVHELWFRGVMQGLLRSVLAQGPRVVVVSVLCGVATLDPDRGLPTAMMAMLLGLAAERSGSLWPPMVLHAVCSATLLGSWWWGLPIEDPPALVAVSGASLCVGCVLWIGRRVVTAQRTPGNGESS